MLHKALLVSLTGKDWVMSLRLDEAINCRETGSPWNKVCNCSPEVRIVDLFIQHAAHGGRSCLFEYWIRGDIGLNRKQVTDAVTMLQTLSVTTPCSLQKHHHMHCWTLTPSSRALTNQWYSITGGCQAAARTIARQTPMLVIKALAISEDGQQESVQGVQVDRIRYHVPTYVEDNL